MIHAKHLWRKDLEGNPLTTTFNETVWKRIPKYTGPNPETGSGQVAINKDGWVQVDPASLVKPKAAQEAEEQAKVQEVPSHTLPLDDDADIPQSPGPVSQPQKTTSKRRRR